MMPTKKQEVSVPSQVGLPQSGTDEYSDDQRDLKMPIGKKEQKSVKFGSPAKNDSSQKSIKRES